MTASRPASLGGKILFCDLTSGTFRTEPTEDYIERFFGARGINQWLVAQMAGDADPLGPDNVIALGAGLLVGTLAPSAGRLTVSAISPLTGATGYSNAGGKFASNMKYAGYDNVIIQGRAAEPVYLYIADDEVVIRPAPRAWGADALEAGRIIRSELPTHADILTIGQAGENLVRYASLIVSSGRAAGRSGFGAVMGSKNLKAIAVSGTGAVTPADPERFIDLTRQAWDQVLASEITRQRQRHGCHRFGYSKYYMGQAKSFQTQPQADEMMRLEPEIFRQWEKGRLACAACPTYCSGWLEIDEGEYAGLAAEGIEASDVTDFGPRLGIYDAGFVVKAHSLVNRYGMDMDSVSVTIAWAMECWQRGLLTAADTGGLAIEWGDRGVVQQLLHDIAHRQGFGAILAEGVNIASQRIGRGTDRYAWHVKGQEMVEDAGRIGRGWGLAAAVDTRGGGHMSGAPATEFAMWPPEVCEDVLGVPTAGDPLSYEGKAASVVYYERLKVIIDSLGMCYLNTEWSDWRLPRLGELAGLLEAATGRHHSADELMLIGDRILNIEKALNTLRRGFTREDEKLPWRFFDEPLLRGAFEGDKLDRDRWEEMLSEYYELHGWDPATGWQTEAALLEAGLPELAEKLRGSGRLSEWAAEG